MSDTQEPKRILHIVSVMDRGGAETLIMNIYRNMDRSKLQFDFISHSSEKGDYEDEIIQLGGKIHRIKSLGTIGPFRYIQELKKVMSLNLYIAIHAHTDFQSGFPALAAKMCGIKVRICHSHSNNWQRSKSLKDRLMLNFLQCIIKYMATSYCSCSKEAAQFLFGNKMVRKGKVEILKNGIEIDQFLKIRSFKEELLEELTIRKDAKIIGHVGKFSESKNQSFILKVLNDLLKEDPTYVALLIGEGLLKQNIMKEARKMGILDNIRFLGVREDIPRLMQSFDVFIFPSIFEGFGIVTLEAQCAGTPCVVSDAVPKITDMGLGLISYLNLQEDISSWVKEIKKTLSINKPDNNLIYHRIQKSGYNIQKNVQSWVSLYTGKELSIDLVQGVNAR